MSLDLGSSCIVADHDPAWARFGADCEAWLSVSGPSSAEAAARLCAHGPDELADHSGPTLL